MYGKAGPRPQVIWPNGVLASTAVGLAVDLVTNWTRQRRRHAYLVYDGNESTVKESATLRNLTLGTCPHFPDGDVGDPLLLELQLLARAVAGGHIRSAQKNLYLGDSI